MNLERLIAENLVRFKVKNMNYELFEQKVIRLLKEQDDRSAEAMAAIERLKTNGEMYNAFRKWEQSIAQDATAAKLTKTVSYVPKTNAPIILQDEFYNNFVTLDKGVKNPAALKKKLDDVIVTLQKQGVNLKDPKTAIEIVSTATEIPASVGPAPNDYPGGKVPASNLKLDHDYGGNLKYDKTGKPTEASREWARDNNNGNKFLAKQRGLSVKAYLESKGVTTPINIIDKIVPKDQKREFRITAMVQGNEKVINPIGLPKIQWSCGASAQIAISEAMNSEDYEMGAINGKKNRIDSYNYFNKMYNDWQRNNQYAKMQGGSGEPKDKELVQWETYGQSYKVFIIISGNGNVNQSANHLDKAVWELTPGLAAKLESTFTSKANTFTGPAAKLKFAGARGQEQTLFMAPNVVDPAAQSATLAARGASTVEAGGVVEKLLESTGQVLNGRPIMNGITMVGSPLQTALTGQDFIAWLKGVCQSLPKTPPTATAPAGSPQKQANDQWQKIAKETFRSEAKGDLKQLIAGCTAAGIQGVAATPQTDPAYWKNAYFFDATTGNNPPQEGVDYGQLNAKTAAAFFEGAKFAQ